MEQRRKASIKFGLAVAAAAGMITAVVMSGYSNLQESIWGHNFKTTVWVNSFNPDMSYTAHGEYRTNEPANSSEYQKRYGMNVDGTGVVSALPNGRLVADGTAHNGLSKMSDGSILVDLKSGANLVEQAELPWYCAANSDCQFHVEFYSTAKPGLVYTVDVKRGVKGSLSGERGLAINEEPCRSKLISYWSLPSNYQFTQQDDYDFEYVAFSPNTNLMDGIVIPLCRNEPVPTPTNSVPPNPTSSVQPTPTTIPSPVITPIPSVTPAPTANPTPPCNPNSCPEYVEYRVPLWVLNSMEHFTKYRYETRTEENRKEALILLKWMKSKKFYVQPSNTNK